MNQFGESTQSMAIFSKLGGSILISMY